jgi:hypothetical protein
METERRRTRSYWGGFFLIVIGFLAFIVSYFILPLYVTTINCFDTCAPPIYSTAWESSILLLSHLSYTPLPVSLLIVLQCLPLLAALLVFAESIGFIIYPQRFFVQWIFRSWLAGIIALLILPPFLTVFTRPEIGYFGMLLGYGLFFVGIAYSLQGSRGYAAVPHGHVARALPGRLRNPIYNEIDRTTSSSEPLEAIIMETQQRRARSHWGGFVFIILGFLAFIISYFFLPDYVTTANCFNVCQQPIYDSTWESLILLLSHLSDTTIPLLLLLISCYLPLLAALFVFIGGMGFIIHPQRFFVQWIFRSWLAGIISLLILLPYLFFFSQPEAGYLGMVLSYGLFFGGYRVFLAGKSQPLSSPT